MSEEANKEIYLYSEGDEYEIVDLLKLSFNEWNQYKDPLNYWKWKWINAPNGYNIVYIKLDDKIVAITHIMYIETKVGNSILKTSYSDDLATHPDYRGRGLYKKLRDLIDNGEPKKGSKIIFSINTHPATIYSNLKRGRSIIPYKIEQMSLINNPHLHFKKINSNHIIIYSIGFNVIKILNKFINMLQSLKYDSREKYKIIQINKFDHRYDEFWNKIKDNYSLIGVKNSKYLNWRYADERGGVYKIYEISENDNILGFMVLQIRDNDEYKTGYIIELLSLKTRDDVLIDLLDNIKKEMKKIDINTINYKTTSTKMIKLVEKFGFIKMPFTKEFQAMYKFIDSDQEKEIFLKAEPDEIYWGYGDYFL